MISEIAHSKLPGFHGIPKKLQIISEISCFLEPTGGMETEQRLTITANGQVWISRYFMGIPEDDFIPLRRHMLRISPEAAQNILQAAADVFSADAEYIIYKDGGMWSAVLTNEAGDRFKAVGPLDDGREELNDLSDLIRKSIGSDELLVFDGNSDPINRFEIRYHRSQQIKTQISPSENMDDSVIRNYKEQLVIDREAKTLEHSSWFGSGCVAKTFYVEGGIESLLDGIEAYDLEYVKGDPPDVVEDPMITRDYEIRIVTKHGKERTVKGSFDKNGLPSDWPSVIEDIYKFISLYGDGEIFDKSIYAKPKRRKSDLIFCNVEFEEDGKTYCYLADTVDYSANDWVVVPAGPDDHEAVVRIVSVEYHQPKDAPFPLKKIKHILRKSEKEGWDN